MQFYWFKRRPSNEPLGELKIRFEKKTSKIDLHSLNYLKLTKMEICLVFVDLLKTLHRAHRWAFNHILIRVRVRHILHRPCNFPACHQHWHWPHHTTVSYYFLTFNSIIFRAGRDTFFHAHVAKPVLRNQFDVTQWPTIYNSISTKLVTFFFDFILAFAMWPCRHFHFAISDHLWKINRIENPYEKCLKLKKQKWTCLAIIDPFFPKREENNLAREENTWTKMFCKRNRFYSKSARKREHQFCITLTVTDLRW